MKRLFVLILSTYIGSLFSSQPEATTAPHFFGAHTLHMNAQEFAEKLANPERRRAQKIAHIVELHKQFGDSLAGNSIRADKIEQFLNALWLSSMDKQQVLDGAKKVAVELELLAREKPHNQLITHLNTAVKAHKNPLLPDLVALKRQYSRSIKDDYRAAQSFHTTLLHNPGAQVGLLGGASILGTGLALRALKKYNKSTEIMALQHHVLRHKIMKDFGSASISKLKGILEGKDGHRDLTEQERTTIERYIQLDANYRRHSKKLLKYAAATGVGGISTLASAIAYKNQTPLKSIK